MTTKLKYSQIDGAGSSVLDYGADPANTAAQNTAAIQAWLDTTDDYLIGAAGTYTIDAKLTSAVAGRIINGNGMKIITDSGLNDTLLEVTAGDQTVENFDFEAHASAECGGIFITGVDNCEIRFCKFTNFNGGADSGTGSGIQTNSLGSNHYIHHNRFIDCHFSHAPDQYGSIHCNAEACIIESNIITDCQQVGITIAGGAGQGGNYTQIINNHIIGKSGAAHSGGVNVDGYTTGVVIHGNTIRDCAVEGILIAGSVGGYGAVTSDVSITNNTLIECVLNEFALQGAAPGDITRVLIEGNKVYSSDDTYQSVVCTNVDHLSLLNNVIYGHDIGYTVTSTSRYHNVSGNTFINQDNVGIACFAANSTYTNNKVYGDGVATKGMTFNAASTAGDIKVGNNMISNCNIGIEGTFAAGSPVFVQNNYLEGNTTDLSYTGELANSSEGNRTDVVLYGEFTLSSGSASISNANVVAGDTIKLYMKTPSSAGAAYISSITGGSGFGVTSTNAGDASTYYYVIER